MKKLWVIFIAMLILVVFTAATALAQVPPEKACAKIIENNSKKIAQKAGCEGV